MKKIILAPGTYTIKVIDNETVIEKVEGPALNFDAMEGAVIVVTDTFFQWTSVFD